MPVDLTEKDRLEIQKIARRLSNIYGLPPGNEEDIAQETMLILISTNPPPEGVEPKVYAVGIVRNLIRQIWTKTPPTIDKELDKIPVPFEDTINEKKFEQEINECVDYCCTKQKDSDLKLVFEYRNFEGKQNSKYRHEMAKKMGLEDKALRTRISRLIKKIRECVIQCSKSKFHAREIISDKLNELLNEFIQERICARQQGLFRTT